MNSFESALLILSLIISLLSMILYIDMYKRLSHIKFEILNLRRKNRELQVAIHDIKIKDDFTNSMR